LVLLVLVLIVAVIVVAVVVFAIDLLAMSRGVEKCIVDPYICIKIYFSSRLSS